MTIWKGLPWFRENRLYFLDVT